MRPTKTSGFRFPQPVENEEEIFKKWTPLLWKKARRYESIWNLDDVYQAGSLGLLYAIRWWNPDKNVPFIKAAGLLIRSYIMAEFRRDGLMIRNQLNIKKKACGLDDPTDLMDISEIEKKIDNKDVVYDDDLLDDLTEEDVDALCCSAHQFRQRHPGVSYKLKRDDITMRIIHKMNDNDKQVE